MTNVASGLVTGSVIVVCAVSSGAFARETAAFRHAEG